MKYYSTQRPVGPGSYPKKDGREEIVNYPEPVYCDDICREAWGYIEYPDTLTPEEVDMYELIPEGMRYWYAVTTTFDDRGRVTAAVTNVKESVEKPENTKSETKRKDIYIDWFGSREEADEFVREAKEA